MSADPLNSLIDDVRYVYRQQRQLAERAIEQIDDSAFFAANGPESNSIAVIMKHVGGNLRSRWSDFLTSDGEKPNRNRDGEFVAEGESRASVIAFWNEGWSILEATLDSLSAADLARTVTIRGEPCTVVQALLRNLAHASHHAGQIVHIAKQHAGDGWQTLSIPRNKSQGVAGNFWK